MINSVVTYRGLESDPRAEKIISSLSDKLEESLPHATEKSTPILRTVLDKSSRGLCRVAVSLRIPGRSFHISEEGYDLRGILNDASSELIRRLRRYKERLRDRRSPDKFDAMTQRSPLIEVSVDDTPADTRNDRIHFDEVIEEELDRVKKFLRRQLRVRGGSQIEHLDTQVLTLLDESVAKAIERLPAKSDNISFRVWLYTCASEVLEDWLEEDGGQPTSMSVDERTSFQETQERVKNLGEEVLDFWQPDEEPHREDLLEDPMSATPEEFVTAMELEDLLMDQLEDLPEETKHVLSLSYVEDFSVDEISHMTGLDSERVKEIRSTAAARLTEVLEQLGN